MADLGQILTAQPVRRRLPSQWFVGFAGAFALALGVFAQLAFGVFGAEAGRAAIAPLALGLVLTALMAILAQRHYPHPAFGLCNTVTLLRGALTVALLVPLAMGIAGGWVSAAVAVFALSLDGVDGWTARRFGQTSRFGARFDMEVDALLAAVLALHAWQGSAVPLVAALVLGGTRYAFVLASFVWPWLAAPLPDRLWRKGVCVVQLGTLILLVAPVLPAAVDQALAVLVATGLLASFACDILWLAARR